MGSANPYAAWKGSLSLRPRELTAAIDARQAERELADCDAFPRVRDVEDRAITYVQRILRRSRPKAPWCNSTAGQGLPTEL